MFKIIVATLMAFASGSTFAFHLNEHERAMIQAREEFAKCFPQFSDQLDVRALVRGDLDEDTNLITKQLFYSHFFNPRKKLKMWRGDSGDRIENLAPQLNVCRGGSLQWDTAHVEALGHALHQIQDMAVPAHVVPVNHAMWDGFESYNYDGDISSGLACDQIRASANEDLETVLRDAAEATLTAVKNFKVDLIQAATGSASSLTGEDFWLGASDSKFGKYGRMGNAFGTLEFRGGWTASDESYRNFKAQQLRLSVRATLRGLVWAFKP